jgi:hypothetical protein
MDLTWLKTIEILMVVKLLLHQLQTLVDKQVEELKNINFLSILSDGSTDISVAEQEIVYIRYVERSVPVTKIISIEALHKADLTFGSIMSS